jgi:hypothetical protein
LYKELEEAKKPPLIKVVKVALENMLQILEILAWGYGSIP